MRRFLILLFFIISFGFTLEAEARKLALLVGVDEYDSVPSLRCCVNDVKALREALLKIGFEEDDIHVLVTGGAYKQLPTKRKIEKQLADLLDNAGPQDMVFISFSGHGAQEDKKVYFCPPDVEVSDLEGTCVSITKMMSDLAKCPAKFKWVVVDACRNDPTRDAKGIGGKGLQAVPSPPAGIALFQSCAEGEESWEDRVSGNGYFTKNFAAALSGEADIDHDGQLTLLEVCKWTIAQTKEQVKSAKKKSQRPYFSGSFSDFTLTEDLNVPKARELVKEAEAAMKEKNYKLAIEKFDAALALCPRMDQWKRERELVREILNGSNELPRNPKAGDRAVLTYDGIDYAFRWCPPGEFMMGSPSDEPGRYDDEQQHKVKITRGFWLLETEVTQAMWESVMGTTLEEQAEKMLQDDTEYDFGGSFGKKTLRDFYGFSRDKSPSDVLCGKGKSLPMYYVNWTESVEFCRRLSSLLKVQVQLPSEAQWEYACRAGSREALPCGAIEIKGQRNAPALDPLAWYGGNSMRGFSGKSAWNSSSWPETQYPGGLCGVHPVGKKDANAWGLYDMIGNVCEWCADWYGADYYAESPTSDPIGPNSGTFRVSRGGCWSNDASHCRSAIRNGGDPVNRYDDLGLRLLVVPAQ